MGSAFIASLLPSELVEGQEALSLVCPLSHHSPTRKAPSLVYPQA